MNNKRLGLAGLLSVDRLALDWSCPPEIEGAVGAGGARRA